MSKERRSRSEKLNDYRGGGTDFGHGHQELYRHRKPKKEKPNTPEWLELNKDEEELDG